jgi:hypothetical protein
LSQVSVEQSCLGRLSHWPVLSRPRLAGFRAPTEARGLELEHVVSVDQPDQKSASSTMRERLA